MKEFSIGEVARSAGITTSALRYYESEGLIPGPRRINGRRSYDDSVFTYLATIRLAQNSGFTVAEMKQLFDSCRGSAPRAWKSMAREKIDELDGTIQRATAMKQLLARWIDCNCVSLDDCRLVADRLEITATGR